MTTPAASPQISKGIRKLARQIGATLEPNYVAVEPGEECLPDRSFENVSGTVRRRGGSMQAGWRLREQHEAFVEGAYHVVWRCPEGRLFDVTPRTDEQTRTLFLADSRIVWSGEAVEPRRLMLNEQPCYCGSGMPFKICHGLAED
jgi:hypothetical protein